MAMGSTGTVNVSAKMIEDIKNAVADYRGKANTLAGQLDSEVNGLIPSSFEGSAATGFKAFYEKTFTSEDGVNPGLENLLKAIDGEEGIAQGILSAIPGGEGVDEKLAEGNNQ